MWLIDTLYLVKEGSNIILGSINIRYKLNDYVYNFGGNIGYGIRPTERRRVYRGEI